MKKIMMLLLAVILLLSLCACGQTQTQGEELEITAKPKVEVEEDPTIPDDTTGQDTTDDQTTNGDGLTPEQQAKKDLAVACIGKDISELYAAIGEPTKTDYAPSCLVDGEDGILYYDGFEVYTNKVGEKETVYDVL